MPKVTEHDDLGTTPLLSRDKLGDALVGARYAKSWRRAAALCAAMRAGYSIEISERQLGSYERGERRIPLDATIAFGLIADPPQGILSLIVDSCAHEHQEAVRQMFIKSAQKL